MHDPASSIQLVLTLHKSDYGAFLGGVSLLRREMGLKAPDVMGLIQHTLGRRDPRGLAEDYLESVRWPVKMGRRFCKTRAKGGTKERQK